MFLTNCFNKDNMNYTDTNKINGVWQFEKFVNDVNCKATSGGLNDQYTFLIEDGYIVISLFSEQLTRWKSKDDIYKLKTKWQNQTLMYLTPLGNWMPLADYDGVIFYMSDGIQKKIFKKIPEEKIVKWNQGLLNNDRRPFDYESIVK